GSSPAAGALPRVRRSLRARPDPLPRGSLAVASGRQSVLRGRRGPRRPRSRDRAEDGRRAVAAFRGSPLERGASPDAVQGRDLPRPVEARRSHRGPRALRSVAQGPSLTPREGLRRHRKPPRRPRAPRAGGLPEERGIVPFAHLRGVGPTSPSSQSESVEVSATSLRMARTRASTEVSSRPLGPKLRRANSTQPPSASTRSAIIRALPLHATWTDIAGERNVAERSPEVSRGLSSFSSL